MSAQENNYYYILYLQYEKSTLPKKVKVNYICQKRQVGPVVKVHWQNKYK